MKILIADSDLVMLNAVGHRLRAEGHEVITTELEATALGLIRDQRPHLVISDVMMQDLSGTSITGMFKRFYRHMPVIVTVPASMAHKVLSSGTLEEEDVILKPINLNELCLRIAATCGSRRVAGR